MKYHQALSLAKEKKTIDCTIEICLCMVIVKEYGWVFRFQTLPYMETGDLNQSLSDGNSPILVLKSGEVWNIPTSWTVQNFLLEWEKYNSGGQSWIIDRIIQINTKG